MEQNLYILRDLQDASEQISMHFPYCNKYEYPCPTEEKNWWVGGWPCPIEGKNWWVGGWVQHAKEYGYQLDCNQHHLIIEWLQI